MTDESSARRKWLSLYVGFQATTIYGVEADRVIVRIVAPLVDRCFERRWIRRFFYIRYSELMPHIRLRLLPIEAELADEVRREVEREITSRSPNAVVGRLAVPEPGTPVLADDERVANLAWVDYEPEVDRYGGLQALRVAERFFEDSSKASIAMLRSLSDSRSSRLGQSLLQMLIVSHSFARKAQAAAALSDFFSRSYLPALAKRFGGEESTWEEAFSHGFTKQASTLSATRGNDWKQAAVWAPRSMCSSKPRSSARQNSNASCQPGVSSCMGVAVQPGRTHSLPWPRATSTCCAIGMEPPWPKRLTSQTS
jgi:thiopeptide-type bacteriocin biosynthesis protein